MSELPKDTIQRAYVVRGGLPRKVLPDLAWLGGCSNSAAWPGRSGVTPVTHEPCSTYLIVGEKTLLLDTGHYGLWYSVEGQLDAMLQGRTLDYVFLSHQEIPHTGNLGRLFAKYPQCKAIGDVRDYHLFHPEIALERLQRVRHGDRLELGDREIVFLDAIWKDLSSTMWAYDTRLKMMFTVDMFGYIHHHVENVCGTMLHEMTPETALAVSNRPALPFTGMLQRDQKARVAAFRRLLEAYPVEIIISGHSGPLMGPALGPNIDKLMHSMETSPPQMLQSGAKA